MTYREYLERQAHPYWERSEPVPIDLFAKMNAEGLDVDALERNYKQEQEANG